MKKKSQSSMEFFILIGFAFMAAIAIVVLSIDHFKDFRNQKEFFLIKDVALKLQKEVSIASSVENGYQRSFELPEKLENTFDYFIITSNTSITINTSRTVFSVRIPEVVGNFSIGVNKIEKVDGTIYVNW
jgi:hypothetical protein